MGIATTLIGSYLLVTVVLHPLEQQRADSLKRAGELRRVLRQGLGIRMAHARLSEDLAELDRQQAGLERRIPDAPREAEFLAQVAAIAQESELEIRDYQPRTAIDRGAFSEIEVTLTCEGPYTSICRFLDQLSRLPRLSKVTRLEITAESRQETYPVSVTLAIYFGVKKDTESIVKGGDNASSSA